LEFHSQGGANPVAFNAKAGEPQFDTNKELQGYKNAEISDIAKSIQANYFETKLASEREVIIKLY
jgi:hypothetical protein